MPSLPGLIATIAWPMPTACAPVGSSRKSDTSLPVGVCAPAALIAIAAAAMLERSRLIDQHDWNVAPNCLAQPAFMAQESLLRLEILQLALALGADEDFK